VRWSLYVLRCGDGSLYTGIALDVGARLAQHQGGKGARYTRGRGPLLVLQQTSCRDRSIALRAEHAFKRLSRTVKEEVLGKPRGLQGFVRTLASRTCSV